MRKVIFILAAVVISTLGDPISRQIKEVPARDLEDLLKIRAAVKYPGSWEYFNTFEKLIERLSPPEVHAELAQRFRKAIPKVDTAYEALYAFAKATVIGDKPADEQITKWAKTFSNVMRESHLNLRNFAGDRQLIDNATMEILKDIVAETPMIEGEKAFLEKMKERLPELYFVGEGIPKQRKYIIKLLTEKKTFHEIVEQIEGGIASECSRHEIDIWSCRQKSYQQAIMVRSFWANVLIDEFFDFLRSEKNVITLFKSWAKFAETLRDPASYESLQAMFNGLARDPHLEAYAILIRELGKCLGTYVSDISKAYFMKFFQSCLDAAKAIFADGQDTDFATLAELANKVIAFDDSLFKELGVGLIEVHGLQPAMKCLINDADRQVYKRILMHDEPILTEETLKNLRQENEKMYALIYLINSLTECGRRRQGLGTEARTYLEKAYTTKYNLLNLAEYMNPSDETKAMFKASVKDAWAKFNALSADAKKEFVGAFPYHIIAAEVLLQ